MITFKTLSRDDLPLLHLWLNKPHMRHFYQKEAITLEQTEQKYARSIAGGEPAYRHLVHCDGIPFGKIQCYRNCDYPDYAQEIGEADGISVDFFIGDENYLGNRLGRRMLSSYLTEFAFIVFKEERYCYVCHETKNMSAIRCSRAVGFRYVKDIIENGNPSKLFKYKRLDEYATVI